MAEITGPAVAGGHTERCVMRPEAFSSPTAVVEKLGFAFVLITALVATLDCGSGRGDSRRNSAGTFGVSKPTAKARPLTDRKFERTPERLARGRYLVNGIGDYFACHVAS